MNWCVYLEFLFFTNFWFFFFFWKIKITKTNELASGEPNAVYVSNHQSLLDLSFFGNSNLFLCQNSICFVVFTNFQIFFFSNLELPKRTVCVAKHTLKYVPLFGLFWMASGNVFIERYSIVFVFFENVKNLNNFLFSFVDLLEIKQFLNWKVPHNVYAIKNVLFGFSLKAQGSLLLFEK